MMVVGWCTSRRICHIVAGDDAAADAADDDDGDDDGSLVMELVWISRMLEVGGL